MAENTCQLHTFCKSPMGALNKKQYVYELFFLPFISIDLVEFPAILIKKGFDLRKEFTASFWANLRKRWIKSFFIYLLNTNLCGYVNHFAFRKVFSLLLFLCIPLLFTANQCFNEWKCSFLLLAQIHEPNHLNELTISTELTLRLKVYFRIDLVCQDATLETCHSWIYLNADYQLVIALSPFVGQKNTTYSHKTFGT